jgi:serine/threonine protein kinase/tetratricopeptide (TPR) repeat protein
MSETTESTLHPVEDAAQRLWRQWQEGQHPDVDKFLAQAGDLTPAQLAAVLRIDQRQRWRTGERVPAEQYLERFPALKADSECALELIYGEFLLREESGAVGTIADFKQRFPEQASRLEQQISLHRALGTPASGEAGTSLLPPSPSLHDAQGLSADAARLPEWPQIPGYKILSELGRGGMGLVFLAEQQHPVRRKVALKVIKPGMDTRQVIARFEAERQALALMDHPNIAKVYDAGATASGRPYFVMELVKGVPITHYCDENRLTPRERLELFVPVCQAVQHAHQKGIIHRDIKPSNVLVAQHEGGPAAKVIDFGVAKAAGQHLTDMTLFTGVADFIGTPLYMSPEQAGGGLDVDTRSDIYSLGALLYELLTGAAPFDRDRFKTMSYDEVRRAIREEEPVRPSSRIGTLSLAAMPRSTMRKTDPKRLGQLIRGELDWIVMKCLEKDRNRRYETANGLAKDLQRFLKDEPVQACPPSTSYRLRKFARKYRTPLRIAGVFAVLLVLAAVVSIWQAVRATVAERRALAERDRTEASFRMARDAVNSLFTQVSQSPKLKTKGMESFRKDLLQSAQKFYERFIREQFDAPGVRYDLGLAHRRLAEIHRELSDYAAAEDSSAKAVAILGELARAQPETAEYQRDLAASYSMLGLVYSDTSRWEEANAAYQQALAIAEEQVRAHPEVTEYEYTLAKTYGASALMYHRSVRLENAEKRFQQAFDVLKKLVQNHPLNSEYQWLMATTQMDWGQVCLSRGWFEKAETALKAAQSVYGRFVRARSDAPPEDWQALARCDAILGIAYRDQAKTESAEAAQQQALEIFEKVAHEHPDVLVYEYDVGRCYSELARTADSAGRTDAALARFGKAIAIIEGVVGKGYQPGRSRLLDTRLYRAITLAGRGDHVQATAEAEAVARPGGLISSTVYNVACVFSRASAAADHDTKLSTADRARLKARYADRAMEYLRQAVAEGWGNPGVAKKDADLDPLRARKDFQKLLADLGATQKE